MNDKPPAQGPPPPPLPNQPRSRPFISPRLPPPPMQPPARPRGRSASLSIARSPSVLAAATVSDPLSIPSGHVPVPRARSKSKSKFLDDIPSEDEAGDGRDSPTHPSYAHSYSHSHSYAHDPKLLSRGGNERYKLQHKGPKRGDGDTATYGDDSADGGGGRGGGGGDGDGGADGLGRGRGDGYRYGDDGAGDAGECDSDVDLEEGGEFCSSIEGREGDDSGLRYDGPFQRPDRREMLGIALAVGGVCVLSVAAGLTTIYDWVL